MERVGGEVTGGQLAGETDFYIFPRDFMLIQVFTRFCVFLKRFYVGEVSINH